MSATISPLSLESYFLTELSYAINEGLEKIPEALDGGEPMDVEVSDSTSVLNVKERLWRCELAVKSAESGSSDFYWFEITMVGFFRVATDWPEEQVTVLAETNCPAVLYSTAREIIATITRRSPYPPLLLPLVTFLKTPDKPRPMRKTKAKKLK